MKRRKLTLKSSNDKLHLERCLSCISISIETDGWPSFILNDEDIQTLIDFLNEQKSVIETVKILRSTEGNLHNIADPDYPKI
jgi:hypothetical protein